MDAVDLKWWSYSHSFGMEEGYYGCCWLEMVQLFSFGMEEYYYGCCWFEMEWKKAIMPDSVRQVLVSVLLASMNQLRSKDVKNLSKGWWSGGSRWPTKVFGSCFKWFGIWIIEPLTRALALALALYVNRTAFTKIELFLC
jgi:hypothetical protein